MASQLISHYRIVSKLGAGGMGEVYLAEDMKLDRKVAIIDRRALQYAILDTRRALRREGSYDEAIDSFKEAQSHGARVLGISVGMAAVYARMGKRDEARRMLAELKAKTDAASFSHAAVATVYAALGDKNEAFKVLFRLVESGDNLAVTLKADPPFESLHSDPRWKELLRRMNFPTPDSPVRDK
jgi:serine/threonine protein kinase